MEEDHQEDAEYDYEDIEHDDDVVACHVNKVCVCEQLDYNIRYDLCKERSLCLPLCKRPAVASHALAKLCKIHWRIVPLLLLLARLLQNFWVSHRLS